MIYQAEPSDISQYRSVHILHLVLVVSISLLAGKQILAVLVKSEVGNLDV